MRTWALAHPQEFALVYGSPVPGYAAPTATIAPASRLVLVLADIVATALADGVLTPPHRPLPSPCVVDEGVLALLGLEGGGERPHPPFHDLAERSLVMWTALIGTLSFELFGHLHNVVTDHAAYFDRAMAVAAEAAGLEVRLEYLEP